jgi:hypothetical protein
VTGTVPRITGLVFYPALRGIDSGLSPKRFKANDQSWDTFSAHFSHTIKQRGVSDKWTRLGNWPFRSITEKLTHHAIAVVSAGSVFHLTLIHV